MEPITQQVTVRAGQKKQGNDLSRPRQKVHPQILYLDLLLIKKKL